MPQTRPTRLQIYGERCSGTNYVAELLRRNLPSLRAVDDFGWKHGWVQGRVEDADDCLFVVVHRDPFDWVRSLHHKPWHAAPALRGLSLPQFLREPWWCVWGEDMDLLGDDPRRGTEMMHERDPATGERFPNVLGLRAAKMRAWHRLRERASRVVFVRYEAVMDDPRAFVRELVQRFGLRRRLLFRNVRTFKGGRERFQPKRYEPIAADDLCWIGSQLDPELERIHGFDISARIGELMLESPPRDG